MADSIGVRVKLFAAYQEAYGVAELHLTFPPQTNAGSVLDYVMAEHPELEQWREVTRLGVNLEFASPNRLLKNGDEVVLVPPVSGG
ncbi:MAG: MoaD/ThiS family protein [Cyanophyceae cyanobacterium]